MPSIVVGPEDPLGEKWQSPRHQRENDSKQTSITPSGDEHFEEK